MLEADRFMVKEQVTFLKTKQTYDIFDFDTEEHLGVAEEAISGLIQTLRWFLSKSWLPTTVEVRDHEGALVFKVRRGGFIFRARVEVLNADGQLIGYFKSKLWSLSGGFWVYDAADKQFAEVKGNFFGFDYRVLTPDGGELGRVNKKWGGVLKELFTSADTYQVEVSEDLAEQPVAKMLVLAAALAIDIIFKSENKGGVSIGGLDG